VASGAPEKTTATTGNGIDGFRLVDLLFHLYENIPGLYEHVFSRESVHRLFKPNRLGSRKASEHHCVIDARVSKKSNSARKMCDGTHFARSQQKLLQEWFVYLGQVLMSGDDMNIIQIGAQPFPDIISSQGRSASGAMGLIATPPGR
jgi:hypothetical protein